MKRSFLCLLYLFLYLFLGVQCVEARHQNTYYLYDSTSLRVLYDDHSQAIYARWQVWLYQSPVHISHYAPALPYARWGLIEGRSAESVMKNLEASRSFEVAYLNYFGSGTWGPYTFLNPIGPIAITDHAIEKVSSAQLYQLSQLNYRVSKLIASLRPSLEIYENNEGSGSPVKEYFDRIKNLLEQATRLSSQLAHIHPQLHFINNEVGRVRTTLAQAENDARKITAVLPSVKLPASHAWMSYTEWTGREGTIKVEVSETGLGVLVQQTWTGGDGSMTGTVVLTTIAYADIGGVQVNVPLRSDNNGGTVRIQAAGRPFSQTMTSPERKTATHVFRAVDYTATTSFLYLKFPNSAEAHDAFAYFEYHRQVGQ